MAVENKTANALGSDELQGQMPAPPAMIDETAAKESVVAPARSQALNHFAGREDALKEAMSKVSDLKKKYNSVESIKNLPRRPPNPMKGKPFIERFIPGVTLQVRRNSDWLLDMNPQIAYRISGRLTAGTGWAYRWAYNFDEETFHRNQRIYGPKAFGEFKLHKGLSPMLCVEYLNVPVRLAMPGAPISGDRSWVWNTLAGMKEEYRITRVLRGNVQILYNFNPENYRNPYGDRLNMRVGFEVLMKKKAPKEITPPATEISSN